jgi:hypothetical protein
MGGDLLMIPLWIMLGLSGMVTLAGAPQFVPVLTVLMFGYLIANLGGEKNV